MGFHPLPYLKLCRPANLPTAAADIIAGMAVAGAYSKNPGSIQTVFENSSTPILLIIASVLLYAGGVVLNDVFDFKIDTIERPERPIPTGDVTQQQGMIFGFVLLGLGIFSAFMVNQKTGLIALVLAISIVLYDTISKKNDFIGPLNMGICRSLNLLLGIAVLGEFTNWHYMVIPLIFIGAVTLISRGEVHGKNKKNILLAAFLYLTVIFCVIYFNESETNMGNFYWLFLTLFAIMVFVPLLKAYKSNTPGNIKKAVVAGVLSLVLLDAAITASHSNWMIALLLVLLLPLSIFLSKIFSVT